MLALGHPRLPFVAVTQNWIPIIKEKFKQPNLDGRTKFKRKVMMTEQKFWN